MESQHHNQTYNTHVWFLDPALITASWNSRKGDQWFWNSAARHLSQHCYYSGCKGAAKLEILDIQTIFNIGLKISNLLSFATEASTTPVRKGIQLLKISVPTLMDTSCDGNHFVNNSSCMFTTGPNYLTRGNCISEACIQGWTGT